MDVPEEDYRRIQEEIESDESPVGIDARRAHVLILYKLEQLERRIAELEDALDRSEVEGNEDA